MKKAPLRKIAFAGLGDMGLPMAKNLLNAGFAVAGFDPRAAQCGQLVAAGGRAAPTCRAAARGAEAAFVMVMDGAQMSEAVLGKNGLLAGLERGAALFITATVARGEVIRLAPEVVKRGVVLIDAPVSGGQRGAVEGKLTFMAAGRRGDIESRTDILRALGSTIHIVGGAPGDGQTVKAVLQGLVGGVFAAVFESLAFGAKAGVAPEVLEKVFSTSVAASPLLVNNAKLILGRRFKGTGSNIATMRKDLGLATALAREAGAPVFAAATARELFQAGATKFPGEDNQAVIKVLEDITGVPVDGRPGRRKPGGKTGGRTAGKTSGKTGGSGRGKRS